VNSMDGPALLFWEWHPCAAKPRPPIRMSAHASVLGETLATHRAVPRPALFLASMLDLGILNPMKELGRKESPLVATNVNPFPAKQPGVYRPCARSEHYQAYSERREQNVHARCGPPGKDSPNLDDCLQTSCNGRPQSCQQQTSDADRDESCVKPVMGRSPKSGAAFK
jgi:hypothetical protein